MNKITRAEYKEFCDESVKEWREKYYRRWLPEMQQPNSTPNTPMECFFKYYTQGSPSNFNNALRCYEKIDECFACPCVTQEMYYEAIEEISKNKLPENVVTYRYVRETILEMMLKWSRVRYLRKGSVIFDKAFISTTLTPKTVQDRLYVHKAKKRLVIYVPEGTPCVYLELIANMNENELLFAPRTKLRIISAKPFCKDVECIIEANANP